jgi:alpha-mannosidase
VVITSLKKAEDDGALVLRFYEWAGKEGDVTLQVPAGAESASETNLMEKPIGSLPVHNGGVTVHTKAFEIKTIKIQFTAPHTTASTR